MEGTSDAPRAAASTMQHARQASVGAAFDSQEGYEGELRKESFGEKGRKAPRVWLVRLDLAGHRREAEPDGERVLLVVAVGVDVRRQEEADQEVPL